MDPSPVTLGMSVNFLPKLGPWGREARAGGGYPWNPWIIRTYKTSKEGWLCYILHENTYGELKLNY